MRYYNDWPAYVTVAERRLKAAKHIAAQKKKGVSLNPVAIEGRLIARTFWGKAWCQNLEAYSDFANRLPRGRTYVRNGSVIDLQIAKGKVKAQVMGSSLYHVAIDVKQLPMTRWKGLVKECAGKIDSLIELLKGKLSQPVIEVITQKDKGLFPKPAEISMKCSCPDSAGMCKHVAAVLYGVGTILDGRPEWLFDLRQVDHIELIASASSGDLFVQDQARQNLLEDDELSALFGIEIDPHAIKIDEEPTSPLPIKKTRVSRKK